MAPLLPDGDKEIIKRVVPKQTNKIQSVAVVRLYVAHPGKQKWVYTGLQGAAVLANDLVGNTYWIKLVDISGANRGVIWDQEIYDPFYYNQDRTFFHSFELEDCMAGFCFGSDKEAKQFKKKMDDREKNASKETKATTFQGKGAQSVPGSVANGKPHSRFGLSSLLGHGSQRHSSAPQVQALPPPQPQPISPQPQTILQPLKSPSRSKSSALDAVDPSWRGLLGELLEMGITEEQIEQNQDFIKDYIEQRKANGRADGSSNNAAELDSATERRGQAPPPPPAPPVVRTSISPQHTGNTSSKRGPAPQPPQPRRSRADNNSLTSASYRRTPSPPAERTPSPPRQQFQFKAPPPLADAGKFANVPAPSLPRRPRAISNVANPSPPPPPRPPKTPIDDDEDSKPKFGVPPPFQGERVSSTAPPPPPSRVPVGGPPRMRDTSGQSVPPVAPAPPLPPKQPSAPPPPNRNSAAPAPPPLPSAPRPATNAPVSAPPPPPPLPGSGPPPPPLTSVGAPPPPPMPPGAGPPPPPLPPGRNSGGAPPLPKPNGGKEDVLASIRATGGIGALKKVSDKEKRDRSAAVVPGAEPSAPASGAPAAPPGGGGLGDALAAALSKRNKKVSASDDEDDDDDDWDDEPKRKTR